MSVPEKGEAPGTTAKMGPPAKSAHKSSRKSHYESVFPPPLTRDETKKRRHLFTGGSTLSPTHWETMSVPGKGEAPGTTAKMDPPGKSAHKSSRKSHYESAFPPPLTSDSTDEPKKRKVLLTGGFTSSVSEEDKDVLNALLCVPTGSTTSPSPMLAEHSYSRHTPYEKGTCRICHQKQRDPVRTPCGDVFCRQCILTHFERQDKAGGEPLDSLLLLLGMCSGDIFYSCPACQRPFYTRPALQPHPGKQHHHVKADKMKVKMGSSSGRNRDASSSDSDTSETGENDPFQSVSTHHKGHLKRMIEKCTKGSIGTLSHTNRSFYIVKEDGQPTPQVIDCNDLFRGRPDKRGREEGQIKVRTVITHGASGFGKSHSVYKFIIHWAEGKTNRDIDFVFILPFWKLNLVKDFACSLHKLLLNFHPELNMLTDVKKLDDANIVVMFDGLDESQLPLDFQNNQMLCDVTETSSVDTVITNVIKGNLLPFAQIWITSDPSTSSQIPSYFINRVTELTLFSDAEMRDCVRESLNDVTQASNIILKIQVTKALQAMCYVPDFCSIAGSVVKNMPEQDENSVIQTHTELYSHYILGQIATSPEAMSSYMQCEGEDRKVQRTSREVVLKFAELAWKHLKKNNLTFSERDLKDCHIDVSDAESFFGLWTAVSEDNCEFFQMRVYHFTHVIIQEFLAALCVFDAWITKNKDILKEFFDNESEFNHEDISLDILLKRAVTQLLNGHYSRNHHFLRFLLGMSLESSQSLLQGLLTGTCSSSAAAANTLQYMKDLGKQEDVSLERRIDLLHCQIEMRDPCVMEDIQTLLKLQRSFSSFHWQEIAQLVQMSEQILDEFNLQENSGRLLVPHVLSIYVGNCRKAGLHNCRLFQASCRTLASVLQQPHCPLRELDISGTDLGGGGLQLLCSGLTSPNCKLEVLRLHDCHLSRPSCRALASVLQQPHSPLRELDIRRTDLGRGGVEQLLSGLKSQNCKLEVLRLHYCDLSASCMAIASVLQQPHSTLRELEISGTDLGDGGVELLSYGLKSPNCKLEVLRLHYCLHSQESYSAIASVLQQPHCPLRELHISGTYLGGGWLQLLCSGLTSPNCKLEVLRLHDCHLSRPSCRALASVLQQPHSPLRELDIRRTDLGRGGVEQLLSGLKSQNCKLEVLRLHDCDLSTSCMAIASVLQQPHSTVRELEISGTDLGDGGVELLSYGLKSPNCKLEVLRLYNCCLSQASCRALASVLQQPHCLLRKLDISGNALGDSGVETLFSGLTSPNCKLEVLRLDGCGLTDKSLTSLASVFESDHSCLREVDVSNNVINEKRVITKRPKDPECKVDTLNKELKGLSTQRSQEGCSAESDEAPGPSGVVQEQLSLKQLAEREGLHRHPAENTGQADDLSQTVERGYFGDAEIFTPGTSVPERAAYRFSCSSSGLHQCLYTGLVFKTDSAAEVEYQAVPWDCRTLEEKGLVAAGPLFKMKGLQGTVSQLGFPHCEIISGDNLPSLTIIHITGSKLEELQPLRMSDTHVFLNISGFCKFGLAKKRRKDENDQQGIYAIVKLFLYQRVLNVLLLPRNVEHSLVDKHVMEMTNQRKVIYIITTSKCKLIPDEEYSLTCSEQAFKIQPKAAEFDAGYCEYSPTFQVFLSNIEHIELSLYENGHGEVWSAIINLPDYMDGRDLTETIPPSPYISTGKSFFHRHKATLETRLGLLGPILTELESCEVLNGEERDEVESKQSETKQNQALLRMLQKKGGAAQEEFYKVLLKKDKFLVKDLESPRSLHTGHLLNLRTNELSDDQQTESLFA